MTAQPLLDILLSNMIWASAAMLFVLAIRRPFAALFGAGPVPSPPLRTAPVGRGRAAGSAGSGSGGATQLHATQVLQLYPRDGQWRVGISGVDFPRAHLHHRKADLPPVELEEQPPRVEFHERVIAEDTAARMVLEWRRSVETTFSAAELLPTRRLIESSAAGSGICSPRCRRST